MSICPQVAKDFNSFPHTVAKVAELLADGSSVCVILGDHESVTTTWDRDIRSIAMKVGLNPKYQDGSPRLGYLCWIADSTVDQPFVVGTLEMTIKDEEFPPVTR